MIGTHGLHNEKIAVDIMEKACNNVTNLLQKHFATVMTAKW